VAADGAIDADVALAAAVPLLVVVSVAATVLASVKLAGFTLAADE
jgi:ABC-2 type transport system permease protein